MSKFISFQLMKPKRCAVSDSPRCFIVHARTTRASVCSCTYSGHCSVNSLARKKKLRLLMHATCVHEADPLHLPRERARRICTVVKKLLGFRSKKWESAHSWHKAEGFFLPTQKTTPIRLYHACRATKEPRYQLSMKPTTKRKEAKFHGCVHKLNSRMWRRYSQICWMVLCPKVAGLNTGSSQSERSSKRCVSGHRE